MAVRANKDFPIFQVAPSGIVWFRSPDEGWYIHMDILGKKGKSFTKDLAIDHLEGREACYKRLRGKTCDITEGEFGQIGRGLVQLLNAQHKLKKLPTFLEVLLTI